MMSDTDFNGTVDDSEVKGAMFKSGDMVCTPDGEGTIECFRTYDGMYEVTLANGGRLVDVIPAKLAMKELSGIQTPPNDNEEDEDFFSESTLRRVSTQLQDSFSLFLTEDLEKTEPPDGEIQEGSEETIEEEDEEFFSASFRRVSLQLQDTADTIFRSEPSETSSTRRTSNFYSPRSRQSVSEWLVQQVDETLREPISQVRRPAL
jgi:hypothetical protein